MPDSGGGSIDVYQDILHEEYRDQTVSLEVRISGLAGGTASRAIRFRPHNFDRAQGLYSELVKAERRPSL